jgi:hypothetical protein
MVFATTTARDAAFGGAGEPALAEGMFAYTSDTNTLWFYTGSAWEVATIKPSLIDAKGDLLAGTAADTVDRLAVGTNGQVLIADSSASTGLKWGSGGKILQVVSVFKADTFSMTGATYTDVTGLSASITPQSSTSKIICIGQINSSTNTGEFVFGQLVRDATVIGNGTGGSSVNAITSTYIATNLAMQTTPIFFVDSPATTSATTYKMQIKSGSAGVVVYINRRAVDTAVGGSSSLILMEVSA